MSMTPPPAPPPPPPAPPPVPPGGYAMPGGPVSPAGQPLGEPWMRILARLIDVVILAVVAFAILVPIVFSSGDSAGFGGMGGDASFGRAYLFAILGAAVGFVWEAVLTKLFGGTPGKLILGMKVVRADNGGPVEWKHASLRWAVPGAFGLIPIPILPGLANLVVLIVGIVFLFSKPLRQTVSDLVAKTLVVKSR